MFRNEIGQTQRVAAYGVCTNADAMLLVRLNEQTTSPGYWTLPGGGIDFGEHPRDAVVRECLEETGLIVVVRELLTVDSLSRVIRSPETEELVDYHAIRIVFRVDAVGGELRDETDNSTDCSAWHPLESMASLLCTDLARLGARVAPQIEF